MRKEHAPKVSRKKEDIDFEIAFYENILKDTPNFIEALSAIGDLYTRAGLWQKGLEVDIKLSHLRPEDAIVFYNLACSYALLNQTRAALGAHTVTIMRTARAATGRPDSGPARQPAPTPDGRPTPILRR